MRRFSFLGRRFSTGSGPDFANGAGGSSAANNGDEAAAATTGTSSTLRAAAQLVLGGGPTLPPVPPERASTAGAAQERASEPTDPLEAMGLAAYPNKVEMKDPRQRMRSNIGLVGFSHPGHDEAWDVLCGAGFLSNFYDLRASSLLMEVPDVPDKVYSFLNAEAAFQALKHWGRAREFQHLSAGDAWRLNRHLSGQEDWTYAGFGGSWEGMASVLRAKFVPETAMAKALLSTGDSFLLHHNISSFRDAVWSDNGDGEGKNLLGMQLMLLRDELSGKLGWTDFIRLRCGVNLQNGEIPETSTSDEEPWQETVRIARVALVSKLPVTKSTVAKVRAAMQKEGDDADDVAPLQQGEDQLLSRGELALIRMLTTPGNRLSLMMNDLANKGGEDEDDEEAIGEMSMSGGDVLKPLPQFTHHRTSSAEARRLPSFKKLSTTDLSKHEAPATQASGTMLPAPPEPPSTIAPLSLTPAMEMEPSELGVVEKANTDGDKQTDLLRQASSVKRIQFRGNVQRGSASSLMTRGSYEAMSPHLSGKRSSLASSPFGSIWSEAPEWDAPYRIPEGKAELNAFGRIPAIFLMLFWIVVCVAQLLANVWVYEFNEVEELEEIAVEAAVEGSKSYALEVLLPAVEVARVLDAGMRTGSIRHLSDYEGLIRILQPQFEVVPTLREVEIVDLLPEEQMASGNETLADFGYLASKTMLAARSFVMFVNPDNTTQISSDRDDCTRIPGRTSCALEVKGVSDERWFTRGLELQPVSSPVEKLPLMWAGPGMTREARYHTSCSHFCWSSVFSLVTRVFANSTSGLAVPAPVVRIAMDVEQLRAALHRIEDMSRGEALICTRDGRILVASNMAETLWIDGSTGTTRSAHAWEFPRDWARKVSGTLLNDAARTTIDAGDRKVSIWPLENSAYRGSSLGTMLRVVVAVPKEAFIDSVYGWLMIPTVIVAGLPIAAALLLMFRGMCLRWRGGGGGGDVHEVVGIRNSNGQQEPPPLQALQGNAYMANKQAGWLRRM